MKMINILLSMALLLTCTTVFIAMVNSHHALTEVSPELILSPQEAIRADSNYPNELESRIERLLVSKTMIEAWKRGRTTKH
ncbi:hypothetical protein L2729_20720 [Shewanella gelidimarina]|uniref:hypothetical protein n=1 Tax=Shewanella gelidimarina TaxID=56813 RepID=UPI00200CCF6A|nr:hypothetical protein [Shewanella gelidimarina]MCL1060391.1 hypothetical protein [Shewanella gelidimarina]